MSDNDNVEFIDVIHAGNWPIVALAALALGVAVTIAAAVILARVGDHHADE